MQLMATLLAFVGYFLNVKKIRWCFAVYFCTDGYWLIHNLSIGENFQAFRCGLFLISAIIGFMVWSGYMEKIKDYLFLSIIFVIMFFTPPEKWFGSDDYSWMD